MKASYSCLDTCTGTVPNGSAIDTSKVGAHTLPGQRREPEPRSGCLDLALHGRRVEALTLTQLTIGAGSRPAPEVSAASATMPGGVTGHPDEADLEALRLPGRQPAFEAPGSTLKFNPDGYTDVELASGRTVRVQDVEEVLLLRLDEFVATGHADVFQQCLLLLRAAAMDDHVLDRRAREQSLAPAVAAVRQAAASIERAPTSLELWEITDLAKSLRGSSADWPGLGGTRDLRR